MTADAHGNESAVVAGLTWPTEKQKTCDELGNAIDEGSLGKIVAKYEKLIELYYRDVQNQAIKVLKRQSPSPALDFGS